MQYFLYFDFSIVLFSLFNEISSADSEQSSNKIKQINAVTSLLSCVKLTNVDFTNNPIVNTPEYRQKIQISIPSLLILDGFGFDETGTNVGNSTECSSSLSSDISKDSSLLSDRFFDLNLISRPMNNANQFADGASIEPTRRPSTAGKFTESVEQFGILLLIILNKNKNQFISIP